MTRMVLNAAKCSQIADPATGATSRGDRCTEVVCAMIDATYQISQQARTGVAPEDLMQELAQAFNQGRDIGVPEDVAWIGNWLKEYSKGSVTLNHISVPGYQEIVESVNRGHVAIGGFSDYVNLQLVDGSHPYDWNDPHGLSHIVLIVGYDDDTQAVVVHDPLRSVSGQPADYSWQSFQAAQFYVLSEVSGPSLLVSGHDGQMMAPAGWSDDGVTLTAPNGVPVVGDFREWVLTHAWESQNWPLTAARQMDAVEWGYPSSGPGTRQDFRTVSLGQPTGQDVYQIWIGQDILALAQQLSDCKSQISQMMQELDQMRQASTSGTLIPSGNPSIPPSGMPQPSGNSSTAASGTPQPSTASPSPAPDPQQPLVSSMPSASAPEPPELPPFPPAPGSQPPLPPAPGSQQASAGSAPSSSGATPSSAAPAQTSQPSVHKALPPHHVASQRSGNSFNLLTLFQRARAYLPLTPAERAFLKFLEGAVCTAIVAAASIIYQGLNQHLDWNAILHTALAAGATALLFTLNKYLTAHLDPTLDDLVSQFETSLRLPTGSQAPPAPGA